MDEGEKKRTKGRKLDKRWRSLRSGQEVVKKRKHLEVVALWQ
jgi:hypothetical protein